MQCNDVECNREATTTEGFCAPCRRQYCDPPTYTVERSHNDSRWNVRSSTGTVHALYPHCNESDANRLAARLAQPLTQREINAS